MADKKKTPNKIVVKLAKRKGLQIAVIRFDML